MTVLLKEFLTYLPSTCNRLIVTILPELVIIALFISEETTDDDKRVTANEIKERSVG